MDNKKRLNEVSSTSLDLREDLVKRLLSVVPEAETDGKIDWDKLKQELTGVIDESPERYNFTWNGKKQAMKLAQLPSTATLKPNKEKSKNWDTTENLYIEGDNLEVLKLLQKSYANKIKLIYIDPPYNTGKDFVYKDNFKDTLANYLEQTGQVDSDGNKLSVNTDTSGRYHTDWLNMMYPRLKLARNLLTDDGAFFVNLSDDEAFNMKKICDEVFGEANFLADIAWNSTKSVTNTAIISSSVTHTLVYFKNMDYFIKNRGEFRLRDEGEGFSNPDMDPRGPWKADPFQVGGVRPNQLYEIINPKTGMRYIPNSGSSWKNDFNKYQELLADNRIVFGVSGEAGPQRKRFLFEAVERGKVSKTLWDDVETTTNGTSRIKKLFGDTVFSNPKPVQLIERIIQLGGNQDSIILDFFSGSGTTAEAVMQSNVGDGGNRKFILVQLPENLDESIKTSDNDAKPILEKAINYLDTVKRPHFLTEIGQERIRLAGDKIVDENPLFASKLDIGFKVFELDKSNIKKWNVDSTNLVDQIEMLQDNFETGSTPLDVVYEIMLKQGHSLTSHIAEENLDDSVVYTVEYGAMFIVLGNKINSSVANYIVNKIKELEIENSIVVFQDQQFESDSEKLNAIEILNENGIEYDNILSI